jgi:hypothetical protein
MPINSEEIFENIVNILNISTQDAYVTRLTV